MSLKRGLFSALKLSGLLHTRPKLELKKGTLLAHLNAPLRRLIRYDMIAAATSHFMAVVK